MGFRLFATHYKEPMQQRGRTTCGVTTLIIAAHTSDPRIRKTPKGLVLDYVTDRRIQPLHQVLGQGRDAMLEYEAPAHIN